MGGRQQQRAQWSFCGPRPNYSKGKAAEIVLDRSARRLSRPAIDDRSSAGPSANNTRSNGASPSAGTAKRKSSNSAAWGESELRNQLLHVSNKMDTSEKARFELEEGVNLFQDALRHRNEAMCEMEFFSNYNFDMYQQYVSTEIECMRESLVSWNYMRGTASGSQEVPHASESTTPGALKKKTRKAK